MKRLSIAVYISLLIMSGCTGDGGSSSLAQSNSSTPTTPVPSSSSSAQSSSAPIVQLNGEQLYKDLGCETCHGVEGKDEERPIDSREWELAGLAAAINKTMPLGATQTCVGDCGVAIADYILSWEISKTGSTVWAVNIGGDDYVAQDGQLYTSDASVVQGMTGLSTDPVGLTSDQALYQSGRWGESLRYNFAVDDGIYDVTLHFTEGYWEENAARVFNVFIEELNVYSNLDVHAQVGHDNAYDVTFSDIPITDGAVTIRLDASVDNASLNGIRIKVGAVPYADLLEDPLRVGPMPLRRLTLQEYNNTVRDLLKTNVVATQLTDFPATQKSDYAYPRRADAMAMLETEKFKLSAETLSQLVNLNSVIPCSTSDRNCARQFVQEFGRRAFRRPLVGSEVDDLLALFDVARGNSNGQGALIASNGFPYCASASTDPDGDGWGWENSASCVVIGSAADPGGVGSGSNNTGAFDQSIRLLVQAILQSPKFLYRWELGAAEPSVEGRYVKLNGYEVASRLAYFIWKTMPDDALLNAANSGELNSVAGVKRHAARLLGDPKAVESVAYFPEYWLDYSKLESVAKNNVAYPEFTDAAKSAMLVESRLFAQHIILNGDANLRSLLTSNTTFVNRDLANIYGVAGNYGDNFEMASLDSSQRSGILTRAAFLAAKGAADGSNPPKRGADVYKQVMCQEIPNPPAIIPDPEPASAGGTTRERFEEHANNSCAAVCHSRFDPIGFSFETFGGIGEFRLFDNGSPVDASGVITLSNNDSNFNNSVELSEIFAASDDVQACFSRQWMRYALDRNEDEVLDEPSFIDVQNKFASASGNIKTLIEEVVSSRSFRYRVPSVGETF